VVSTPQVYELGASHMPNGERPQLRSHGGHTVQEPTPFSHQHHAHRQAGPSSGYQPQLQQHTLPQPMQGQHNMQQQQCSGDQNMAGHHGIALPSSQAWLGAHQVQVQHQRQQGGVFSGAAAALNYAAEGQTPTSAGVHPNSTAGAASRSFQYVQGCTAEAQQPGANHKPLHPTRMQQGVVQRQQSQGPLLYRPQPQRPQALQVGAGHTDGGGGDGHLQQTQPTPHSGRPTSAAPRPAPQHQQDDIRNGVAVATHLVLERSGSAPAGNTHDAAGAQYDAHHRLQHQQPQGAGAGHHAGVNGGCGFGSMFSSPGGPGPVCGLTGGTMSPLVGLGHFANGEGVG
jgi:hypothetical protein